MDLSEFCRGQKIDSSSVPNGFKRLYSQSTYNLSVQLGEETINWAPDFSSAFFLTAEKTSVEGQEELLVFDFEDLINGIGGALGLFLGWSLLYLGMTLSMKYL